MRATAVPLPAQEFLAEYTHSDHGELQVEPLRAEQQKKIGTEYDREWPETQRPTAPAPSKGHRHTRALLVADDYDIDKYSSF